jgi:hypothetical protein
MSFDATSDAWKHIAANPQLASTRRIVLLALAECHNKDTGQCNPSMARLHDMTGLKVHTIAAAIRDLEEAGLLNVFRTFGKGSSYQLATYAENGTSAEMDTTAENGITPMPKTAQVPMPKTAYKPGTEPGRNQETTAQRVREEDKQPLGASGGGEGPHNGDSAKPKTARAISMTDTWTPSEDCWRLVDKAGIPRDFAESMMGEFRLYWRDEGTRRKSWNATFLNRVKDQWARRKPSLRVISHATHQRPDNSAPGKVARAIAERDAKQSAGASIQGNDCIELGSGDYYAVAY